VHVGKCLDEVHRYFSPHHRWDFQRLQDAGGMELLYFVLLAHRAGTDKVLDDHVRPGDEEVGLDVMSNAVHARQDARQTWGRSLDEDAAAHGHQVIDHGPLPSVSSLLDLLAQYHHSWVTGELGAQFVE
jgi:hypothetical protein